MPPNQLIPTTPGNNPKPQDEVTVVRISDADPAMLRYFSDIGLTPDTQLTI
ncbi:FeoA family protein, partial [Arthrobacter sp. CAN_A214]|uniref:FeoA family protein n=1 Tax=Arthrobacter sp. CAN_A214 TaxID=2787720 RepID=UPI0018CAA926